MGGEFDVIVVGSGISGGWAAKELCEAGLKTLMIDRGYMVEHGDYPHEGKGDWQMPHRGSVPPAVIERDHFISQHAYINEFNQPYLNNDRLNPYDYAGGSKFWWIRPASFGGKSLLWSRWALRLNPLDFGKNDGRGAEWPISYDDIAPWYAHAERFVGVAGDRHDILTYPDGEFQPAHKFSCGERFIAERLKAAYPDRRLVPGRVTNMTEDKPEEGRTRCQYRNQCHRGCSFGAYFSTQSSTLPAAKKTGNLTVLADHVVASLEYDPKTKRVVGVRAVNTKTKARRTLRARMVFLNASTIGSLQILLNSRSAAFPTGLANSSGMLGKYVMDKPFLPQATGEVPGFEHLVEYGRPPGGSFIPRFKNLAGKPDSDFAGGYNFYVFGGRDGPSDVGGFGVDLKRRMRVPGPWRYSCIGFGECLPYEDNHVSLHPNKVDRFGIPLVTFNVTFRENERKIMKDMVKEAEAMWRAIGMRNVEARPFFDEQVPGRAIHECGGARMGEDPRKSVLNKWSQAHDIANLFVTDGSGFCSSGTVNPSLTYMALTARAANHAVELLRAGQI